MLKVHKSKTSDKMKNVMLILTVAMMLLVLVGCADEAGLYKADSSRLETEATSVGTEIFSESTEAVTTEPTDQSNNKSVGSSEPSVRKDTSSKAQQNDVSKENNSQSATSKPKSSEAPITLSLDKSTINLAIGETVVIKATVNPSGSTVTWSSGEDNIASVTNGTVTGISAGATVIIATVGGQEKRCTVIVQEKLIQMNPQPYIDYATRYGESLGLKYDETHVSRGNWNPWVNLYSALGEETMKRNIRDALQILVDEGRKYFFVYGEPQADMSYHMYIFFG